MTNTGGIGANSGAAEAGDPKKAPKRQETKINFQPTEKSGRIEQSRLENKVYRQSTDSQQQFASQGSSPGFEAQENLASKFGDTENKQKTNQQNKNEQVTKEQSIKSKTGLSKDYEVIGAKNPTLAAKLEGRDNPKSKMGKDIKNKRKPPKPSTHVLLNQGRSKAINPHKPQIILPKRLQALKEKNINNLQELKEALGAVEASQDPRLIAQYTKKLLKQAQDQSQGQSLANWLKLDVSVIQSGREALIRKLSDFYKTCSEDQDLANLVAEIIADLKQPELSFLRPLTMLFMPLPLPFVYFDPDEEFLEDEEELLNDYDEESSGEEDEEEENDDAYVRHYDSGASLAIKTLNYGKLHLLVNYDSRSDRMFLYIKGDEVAEELAVALESNLEAALKQGTELMPSELKLWHDNVLRITESRTLAVDSRGKLSEQLLRACNNLLETVLKSDIEDHDAVIDYDVL
jgi:hypothetical protein